MTLGVVWNYLEGSVGVTLGVDWGNLEGTLGSVWRYLLDYVVGSMGSL